jgi:hypothetical protein
MLAEGQNLIVLAGVMRSRHNALTFRPYSEALMGLYERMTRKQLKEVVSDYAETFGGWSLLDGTAFVREQGPVRQTVWFEALRTGAYRPSCGISAVALPIVRMLPQMLDVRINGPTFSQPGQWWNP